MADVSKDFTVEEVAESLVKTLTGFKNGSDNFKQTIQYVLSNFKYHRYLDVDSHKITREIKGIKEKLRVHSKADKAEALDVAINRFLNGPVAATKPGHFKSDAHYAVISVLLLLSGSPSTDDYEEKQEKAKKDGEPEFDWGKYLLEDLEPIKDFDEPSSDEWEDEEEVVFPEENLNDSGVLPDQSHHNATLPGSQSHHLNESSVVTGTMVTSGGEGDRGWLDKNIVVQYWQGERDDDLQGIHRNSTVTQQWESHEKACQVFPVIDNRYQLTETHIIRETIWILMGAKQSFVYHRHGNTFEVRENLQVNHLTTASLESMLQSLATTSSCVLQLQSFVDEMRSKPLSYCNRDSNSALNSQQCQTYEAYAEALATFLHTIKNDLVQFEKTVLMQEEQVTLGNFMDHLSVWTPKLRLLASVHAKAVVNCSQSKPVYRVWYLLKSLQESIMEQYSMGHTVKGDVTLLIKIWMRTIRPYVNFIDRWLTLGHLYDPAQEFFIQRNTTVDVTSENFWQEGFTLLRFQSANEQQVSQRGEIAVPPFLAPLLRHVTLAGKCMEVLESVGQLGDITSQTSTESTSMYDQLILSSRTLHTSDHKPSSHGVTADIEASTQQLVHQLRLPGTTDPLLAKNFDEVYETLMLSKEEKLVEERTDSSDATILPPGADNTPLSLVIKRCLYPPILSRCNIICQQLVCTLKSKYALMENLSSLRKFYLLEDGDVMCDFYVDIFERLRRTESWSDYMYLNGQLHEALRPRYPDMVDRLFVTSDMPLSVNVNPGEASMKAVKATRPIHALDCITLHYQVTHPMDIVINKQCIDTYNKVFRFLLQVKRAKHSLDQVLADLKKETHTDIEDDEAAPSIDNAETELKHRLYILRFNFMHFVNSIHTYLMTRILHSTSLEFQQAADSASDLDSLLVAHETYLSKVLQRCLLHEKAGLVREAILKVLNMALVYQRRWDAGIHTFSIDSVNKMESEFHNCTVFLSTLLNSMTKRGAFPHLAALSFSLASIQQTSTASSM